MMGTVLNHTDGIKEMFYISHNYWTQSVQTNQNHCPSARVNTIHTNLADGALWQNALIKTTRIPVVALPFSVDVTFPVDEFQ